MSLAFQLCDETVVCLVRNCFRASHDPSVFPAGDTDDGGLVIGGEVGDQIVCFERPDELHPPFRVGLLVVDEAFWIVGFQWAFESAFVEREGCGDCAVIGELVGLLRVVGLGLEEIRDISDHIPVAHEALEIDLTGDWFQFSIGFRIRLAAGQAEGGRAKG